MTSLCKHMYWGNSLTFQQLKLNMYKTHNYSITFYACKTNTETHKTHRRHSIFFMMIDNNFVSREKLNFQHRFHANLICLGDLFSILLFHKKRAPACYNSLNIIFLSYLSLIFPHFLINDMLKILDISLVFTGLHLKSPDDKDN